MRVFSFALILMLLAPWRLQAGGATHDVNETRLVRYKVSKSGEGLKISGKGQVTRVYLSDRATLKPDVWFDEPYKAKIDKIKARFRGRKLKGRRISAVYYTDADVFFQESRSWHIDLPADVKSGDSLWLEYRINYGDVIWYPRVFVPNVDQITRYELRYEHPKNVRIEFDFVFPQGSLNYRVVRPSEKETSLIFDTIPKARRQPHYALNDWRAAVITKFYRDAKLVNPVTVSGLSKWYGNLVGFEPRLEPDSDSVLARNLSLAVTDLEKLQVIHDHVRKNIRYIHTAERSHQVEPAPPADVLSRRYGDCKDRAFLVQALAGSQGIDVDLALVYAKPDIPYAGTHISFMNHAICAYESDDNLIFMDPTAKYTPFGSMPESVIGKDVVIIDKLKPRKVTVPVPRVEPMVEVRIEAAIDSLDAARAEIVLTQAYRSYATRVLEEKTTQAFEEALDEIVTASLYKIGLDSFTVMPGDSASMVLAAAADLSDLIIKSPRRTYVPHLPFNVVDSDILERAEDSLPLHFAWRSGLRLTIELAGAGLRVQPDSVTIGDDAVARFWASARQTADGTVRLTYAYDRHHKIMRGDLKAAWLEFCRACLSEKQRVFNLEGETQ